MPDDEFDHDFERPATPEPLDDFETRLTRLELEMREKLRLDPQALNDEFVGCASAIGRVGELYARSIDAHLKAKIRTKKLWALLQTQARDDFKEQRDREQAKEDKRPLEKGQKRDRVKSEATEANVDAWVHSQPSYIRALEDEAEAEALKQLARSNLDAMMARKDCLVQLGAGQRAEMERDPVLRDRQLAQRSARRHEDFG